MAFKWSSGPAHGRHRAGSAPEPRAGRAVLEDGLTLHSFLNFLVAGGADPEVRALHQYLTRAPALSWRPAEDVEREVVLHALKHSRTRIEALTLEHLLSGCEVVENRHLIDDGSITRHFRNMWHASSSYCRAYVRGLLALGPADVTQVSVAGRGASPVFREGFSLTRMVLPPYRILQGSYRYAGRSWCMRNWGTPEDARLLSARVDDAGPRGARCLFEFETVDGAPIGALHALLAHGQAVAIACVCVDRDSGLRLLVVGGQGQPEEVTELPPLPHPSGTLSLAECAGSRELAVTTVAARLGTV